MRKPNGFILHETATLVAIATGFRRKSSNIKTADMVQIWFLNKNVHPVEAQKIGADSVVCGNCPLRPSVAERENGKKKRCYVRTGQAPASIFKAFKRGSYPRLQSTDIFAGRKVRFGAYGGPDNLPLPLLSDIASKSTGWTGYTHQWRNPLFAGYKPFLMASADDVESQIEATKAGWRTFRVAPKGSSFRLSDEIICPASKEAGHKTNCDRCGFCRGASIRAKNVVIQAH